MQIEVTSRDMLYMRSLLAGNSYSQGMEIPGPPGTTLRYEGAIESRGVDILNRTDFGGGSIALKEDGVHDRYDRPPKLSSLSA